jgi:hypothetical protein
MKNGNGHHKKDDFIAPARRRMPDSACRLSWEKKVRCASFAPDKDSPLIFNRTITLKDAWAKEAHGLKRVKGK